MTPDQFIDCCAEERASLLAAYFDPSSGASVAADIQSLQLSEEQRQLLQKIVGGVLTDTFYTMILGLDGAASIGGRQEGYVLHAEDGTELTGSGLLEGLAYERFHTHGD